MECVVLQGHHHLLLAEVDALQLQGSVPVGYVVGLLVVSPVEHLDGQIGLVLGHLDQRRVGDRQTSVSLALVVVEHDPFHHPAWIRRADPEDISLDSIIENPVRDLYLVFGFFDVIP